MASLEDWLHPLLGRYVAAPQWAKSLAGSAWRALPQAWRHGPVRAGFSQLLAPSSPEAVADDARRRLASTLRWAADTVPACQGLPAPRRPGDDPLALLAQWPVVDKATLKRNLGRHLSNALPAGKRLPTFTGGSTAEPMKFYLHKGITRSREYAFMDAFHARVGYREGHDLALALRGRVVPTAQQPGGRLWMMEPIKRHLILSSDHLKPEYMPAYVAALRRWCPPFVLAYPSALYPLARWLAEHPAPEVSSKIRGILLYSENVLDHQLALIRQVFGCPVLRHYGHSERVLMAATLPDDDRFHFWPQYGHLELLDARGQAVTRPGEMGEIVGTSFDNQVMPFVRYRTGDMATLSDRPAHPSLAGWPVLQRIDGRMQEFVVCRDERLISICAMGAAHFDELAPVQSMQFEQHAPGQLVLNVVSAQALSEAARLAVCRSVAARTQQGCEVTIQQVAAIKPTRQGKHRMLVQHLDLARYFAAVGAETAGAAPAPGAAA